MLLLMEYSQKRKVFSLWAKYEIFGEDLALVEKYNIDRFKLVEGNVLGAGIEARRRSFSSHFCSHLYSSLGRTA